MTEPTFNALDILNYIIGYKREWDGLSPTIREIADTFNIPSTGHVHAILANLERDGKIKRRKGRPGIMVTGGKWVYQNGKAAQ